MKTIKNIMITMIFALVLTECTKEVKEIDRPGEYSDVIFQYSTKVDLMKGVFEGNLTQEETLTYGNFGIGTFNGVDGEMAIYEGIPYRVSFEGPVTKAPEENLIPFVMVKHFSSDESFEIDYQIKDDSLKTLLQNLIAGKDHPVAIKISGSFSLVKARSVPKQRPPFPSIVEVVEMQSVFDLQNTAGNIIGFWLPPKFDNINFPGFHFHYLDNEFKSGGHVLEFSLTKGKIEIDYSDQLEIRLIN